MNIEVNKIITLGNDEKYLVISHVVNNLKAFIEPILISFLALVVGGIIIAVVVPMFSMYGELGLW